MINLRRVILQIKYKANICFDTQLICSCIQEKLLNNIWGNGRCAFWVSFNRGRISCSFWLASPFDTRHLVDLKIFKINYGRIFFEKILLADIAFFRNWRVTIESSRRNKNFPLPWSDSTTCEGDSRCIVHPVYHITSHMFPGFTLQNLLHNRKLFFCIQALPTTDNVSSL